MDANPLPERFGFDPCNGSDISLQW